LLRDSYHARTENWIAIPELGKAVPYGVYDIAGNAGWVNLCITHDTAAFAVESIWRWWKIRQN
jgi:hypothetical protein